MIKRILTTLLICILIPFAAIASSESGQGPKLTKLRIYLDWFPNVEFAGIFVAREKGWYKKSGIDLEVKYGGLDLVPAIETGKADIGLVQAHDLIRAVGKGSKVKAFAANYQMSPVCILVGQDSNINSIKDLKGKKLAIFSPHEYDIFKIMLASAGLSLKDVKFVNVDTLNEMKVMRLMKSGKVDAVTAWEFNWGLTFSMLDYKVRVFPADKNGFHYYGVVYFGSSSFVEKNKDMLDRFLKVTFDGWREVYKNPDHHADFIVKNVYPKDRYINNSLELTLKQQRLELRLRERYLREGVGMDNLGQMSKFKWQQSLDISRKYGVIAENSALTVNDVVDVRFLPRSKEGAP